jgi:hypothetical protein
VGTIPARARWVQINADPLVGPMLPLYRHTAIGNHPWVLDAFYTVLTG